jgi:subtilisin family serine protease
VATGTRARPAKAAKTGARSAKSRKAPPPPHSIVVYVPGVGRQATASDLKLEWDLAVFGRDLASQSRMAYGADLLVPQRSGASSATDRAEVASTIDIEAILRRASLGTSHAMGRRFVAAMLEDLGMHGEARDGQGSGTHRAWPAKAGKKVNIAFVEEFIASAAAYFLDDEKRTRSQQSLEKELRSLAKHDVTIVAHGIGSIIAYEVLARQKPRNAVPMETKSSGKPKSSTQKANQRYMGGLVTLGSPLGLQEVRMRLLPSPPMVPAAIERWRNFAHPLDVLAAEARLTNDFAPRGTIEDERVISTPAGKNWDFDPHSAIAYLSHPSVRAAISDDMRMDVMARFVIARDVVERFDAPEGDRHPVLIEVLEPGYAALDESEDDLAAWEKKEREVLQRANGGKALALTLEQRIASAAAKLEKMVSDKEAANIDPLRRFVAAHLTAAELRRVSREHRDLRVYAVWRSSQKRKLTARSMRPLKCDAGLASFGADGNGITWAVLDTGILGSHPHFKDVITAVWDCTGKGPPRPIGVDDAQDPDGHGTHVSGIIAGSAPRYRAGPQPSERGAAPRARLVVYKVLDDKGQGEDAWIIKALDHIAEQNENVTGGMAIHGLNLSLGGPFDNSVYGCGFSPICAELRRLWRAGVLVVVACGNEGVLQVATPDGDTEINSVMSIGDPANLEDCIAVGSVNADRPNLYGVSSFSSRGPTADGRVKPDVVAPGERISSCNARYRGARKDLYYKESGTSMAAPHISGLLAAFLSVRREFRGRPDEVKKVLLESCIDLGRDRYHQGRGIPNLMQMLMSV